MRFHTIFTFSFLLQLSLLVGNYASANDIPQSVTTSPDFPVVAGNPEGYFTYRHDERKCPSPLCGGYFIKRVNKATTRCVDGSLRAECYVANIVWATKTALPFPTGTGNLVLKGRQVITPFPLNSLIGTFRVSDAFVPATNKPVNNNLLFVNIVDNGIRCITTPCFSLDERLLNTTKTQVLSGFDLSKTGASQKQIDLAVKRIFQGGLIAVGYNHQTQELTGAGLEFIAENFYFPIKKPAGLCPAGYRYVDGLCKTPIGCIAPQIELMVSGGAAMIDPITGQISSYVSKSCVTRCDPPQIFDGPAHCSVFLP